MRCAKRGRCPIERDVLSGGRCSKGKCVVEKYLKERGVLMGEVRGALMGKVS